MNTQESSTQVNNPAPETVTIQPLGETSEKNDTKNAWFGGVEETVEPETTEEEVTQPVATETVENDNSEADNGEDVEDETEKKSGKGFEKRIERFNRRLSEKDAEIEFLRKLATGNTSQQPVQTAPQADEPRYANYNGDIDAFTKAHSNWSVQQALQQFEQKNRVETVTKTYKQREEDFKKVTPDYEEALADLATATKGINAPEINQYLVESDFGPQVYYHLATNREDLNRILSLPPYKRLGELGRMEARFAVGGPKATKVAPKVTKAPAPVSPEKGNPPTIKDIKDPNLSQVEYRELRMKTLKKKM